MPMNEENTNNHGPARDSLDSLPLSRQVHELKQLLADIKAWDIENYALDIPLPLRQRMQAALGD